MSDGFNQATLLGTLGMDPELRMTSSGTPSLNLRMACNERYKAKDGEWKERTEWISVVVWGSRADALAKLLAKGDRVFITGRIATRSYEKDGGKRYITEVVAQYVGLCGTKREPRKEPAGDSDDLPF
jgi:single-strand DNA-binding protein